MADSVDVPTEIFVEDDTLKLVMPSEHPCFCQDSGGRARSPELRGKNSLLLSHFRLNAHRGQRLTQSKPFSKNLWRQKGWNGVLAGKSR